jgi:predicted solute-binding protein
LQLSTSPFRICAVNYLNTVPLVWGMQYGPQRERVALTFEIPAICAEVVERNEAQIGLAPVAEVARQALEVVPGHGIACHGAVRSILLVSRTPIRNIRTLATDLSSRTSVQLARIVLRERYGVQPEFRPRPPVLETMLAECEAALLIGDPALRIDPATLPYETLDLGAEWQALTGLPMVFALWAGKAPLDDGLGAVLEGSYQFGHAHIDDIVEQQFPIRRVTRKLAYEYLTHYIHFEIGGMEMKGLEAFLKLAALPRIAIGQAASQ